MKSSKEILKYINSQIELLETLQKESEIKVTQYKNDNERSVVRDTDRYYEDLAELEFHPSQLGALVSCIRTKEFILTGKVTI